MTEEVDPPVDPRIVEKVQLNVRMDPDLAQALRVEAARLQMRVSAYVEAILEIRPQELR